jgi:hypothetical protein
MSQPNVTTTELDGQLAATPDSGSKLLALIGAATAGPFNLPAGFARTQDVIANFQSGPLVEAACTAIDKYKKQVLCIRSNASVAGVHGNLDVSGVAGTSVVTLTGTPTDDVEPRFKVVTPGTVGVAGITFQWSLDNGRNWSQIAALGTANTFAIPGSGMTLNFADGTLAAGDQVYARSTGPQWGTQDLSDAVDALRNSAQAWEILEPVGAIDANAFDTLETKFAAMATAGKYRAWSGNTRMPNVGETEAQYLAALNTIFASKASTHGELSAGAHKILSSVTGRIVRRPISFTIAALESSVSEEVNIADVSRGPLAGVAISDANGNPDEHDESIFPGLDDARFLTLRTIDGLNGVYVNRPRLFSSVGSDFSIMPYRRVMNIGHAALRLYFMNRLNKPILVSKKTGYILESEALEIESGARSVMRSTLLAKPKASDINFVLSRTDNLLSTKTLNGIASIIPLAYPEFINLAIGFLNPALQVQAV